MRAKVLSSTIVVVLLLSVCAGVFALGNNKRLGYGFDPSLQAGKDFVAAQLIVGLQEGMTAQGIKQRASSAGVQVPKEMEGALLLQFGSEEAAVKAVSVLLSQPEVLFVERNGFIRIPPQPELANHKCGGCNRTVKSTMNPQSVGSDPGTGYQWHLTVIRKTASGLPTPVDHPPTVAVIDTGVDYTHPDLSGGKVILGKDFVGNDSDPMDDNGHGTHVAGIIGAKSGSGYGEGVCPNCKILAIKVLGPDGFGTFFDVAEGMQYAIDVRKSTSPATKVVNMSLSGPNSQLIASKVLAMKNAGMVLVAAAGDDDTTDTVNAFPGADPNTGLRVMATDQVGCRAWFSNFSPSDVPSLYNIAAPGWNIYSSLPEASFGRMSGTSAATAIVAGASALLWGQITSLTRDTLISRLTTYGRTVTCGFAVATPGVDVRRAITTKAETAAIGQILDPFTGKPPSPPTTPAYVRMKNGTTQLGNDSTNSGGSYEITLSAGAAGANRNLSADRTGYINTMLRYPITITTGKICGPYLDAIPAARATGNVTILFDWKDTQPIFSSDECRGSCLGWEFDLYVRTPSESYIGWDNPGDLRTPPYVRYPRDSANDLIPIETIVIGNTADDGVYKVFVDKYPYEDEWNPSWLNSQASFQVYNGGTAGLSGHYYTNACTTQRYWYVGNLTKNGTAYTWTNVDSCTDTRP